MAAAGDPSPPPARDDLLRLSADAWAELLPHVRAVLNEDLADHERTARQDRLRAAPASRLAGGPLRRELASELARGGPLWDGVAERCAAGASPELDALLRGERSSPRPSTAGGGAAEVAAGQGTDRTTERRLRDRMRELKSERDAAQRRADGADGRVRTLEGRVAGLEQALAEARERVAHLEERLADAEQERRAALDRQRRQHEREVAELKHELGALRRAEQERAQRRRAGGRTERETSAPRADDATGRDTSARGDEPVRPGRPTRLPGHLTPGTTPWARALLAGGRLVLVDGYNVTKQHRGHVALSDQRRWLVRLLEQVATRYGAEVEVVFDAWSGGAAGGGPTSRSVRVRYAPEGQSADDDLVFAVAALPEDRPVLVVTDDHELRQRLAAYAVDLLGTHELLWAAG